MILHDAGRDTEARLQLRESLRLREAMPGDHQGLLGDPLRLLGETSIGLGDHATAERQLRPSVTLAREGYGATHLHAIRPELSLARTSAVQAKRGAVRVGIGVDRQITKKTVN